jgi:hypothetical protein
MALTFEQLEQLIRGLKVNTEKHFTHCPARFSGTQTREAVDDFLATVDFFKTCEGITDNNAAKGLTLLLKRTAHTWWTGIKGSIFIWTEAQTAIRNEFVPSPSAYQVYQQVFATTLKTKLGNVVGCIFEVECTVGGFLILKQIIPLIIHSIISSNYTRGFFRPR